MDFDFHLLKEADDILAAFEKENVRYALAGGFAVALYGHVRATRDMDYLCHPDDCGRASTILSHLGYKAYAEPWTFRQCGITLHRYMKPIGSGELFHVVDLLVPPKERICWITQAERVAWGEDGAVSVVSRGHLLEMKKLRGSAMDQNDIANLESDA